VCICVCIDICVYVHVYVYSLGGLRRRKQQRPRRKAEAGQRDQKTAGLADVVSWVSVAPRSTYISVCVSVYLYRSGVGGEWGTGGGETLRRGLERDCVCGRERHFEWKIMT
jgi:hypothetical protein